MTFELGRFARFLVVGASGVAVNMGILILLTQGLAFYYAVSSLFAIECSILTNFILNNTWTWSDRRAGTLGERVFKYHMVAGFTAVSTNWCLLILLTRFLHLDYRVSNLIGITAGMALNFIFNHKWTFRVQPMETSAGLASRNRRQLTQYYVMDGISPRWHMVLVGLLGIVLVLRVVTMAKMPLLPEEAYYWMYSQHPNLSYYDHPPMVAWVIWFGTHLFGNTEFGVRLGGALMSLAASGSMYIFSRIWFNRRVALVAALLLQILPVYFGAGLIATMDSALMFFWLVCLVGTSLALKRELAWGWYLAGIGLGGALLSKYTGIFLGLGALLAVVGHPPWRKHLRSIHPYAATLLAFAMFTPVLVWNAQHDWASFRFQFLNRFDGEKANVENAAFYVLFQLAVATPLLLAGVVWLYGRILRKKRRLLTPRSWLIVCFSLPLLLVMSYKSLRFGIHLNWTLPAYLSVIPAVAQTSLSHWRCARKELSKLIFRWMAFATVAGCLLLNLLAIIYVLALQPRTGWIPALGPWLELTAAVEKAVNRVEAKTGHEPLIITMDKYRLASVLAFYVKARESNARESDFTTSQWIVSGPGLGFPYWAKEDQWINSDCVIVYDRNELPCSSFWFKRLVSRFDKFEPIDELHLGLKTYDIAIGSGLRGEIIKSVASRPALPNVIPLTGGHAPLDTNRP